MDNRDVGLDHHPIARLGHFRRLQQFLQSFVGGVSAQRLGETPRQGDQGGSARLPGWPPLHWWERISSTRSRRIPFRLSSGLRLATMVESDCRGSLKPEDRDGAVFVEGQADLAHAPGQREQRHIAEMLRQQGRPGKGKRGGAMPVEDGVDLLGGGVIRDRHHVVADLGHAHRAAFGRHAENGVAGIGFAADGVRLQPSIQVCARSACRPAPWSRQPGHWGRWGPACGAGQWPPGPGRAPSRSPWPDEFLVFGHPLRAASGWL